MIYLDWAATSIPSIYVSDYAYNWFNPNSHYAVDEVKAFSECEQSVKEAIGAKSGKVIFGGNTSWFFEKLYCNQANFWFCSPYEHDCIYKNGVEMDYKEIECLTDEIYCHQFVNNITGEIFDVGKIGSHIKEKSGYFVCDATAAIGKAFIPQMPNIDQWCDALVLSSHKIRVDNKQIGCAWISDEFYDYLYLSGTVLNGYNWCDGTPDLACAKATTKAIEVNCNNLEYYNQSYNYLVWELASRLNDNNIRYKGVAANNRTGAINAITLKGINADVLCRYLADRDIYISPGHSACEENSDYRVLKEYGLTQEECESTIRVSFGPRTTKNDIYGLVDGIVRFKEEYCNG